VRLSGYWIYKNLVTVGQYSKFCAVTGHPMPPEPVFNGNHFNPGWSKGDHPIVCVTWDDAVAYAQWAHADLPTEAQWEKAARGTDGRKYPWGDKWDPDKCRCSSTNWGDSGGTSPVSSYRSGASPYGCMDMAGNAFQWCKDWYDPDYWKRDHGLDPEGPPNGDLRAMRGGSWDRNYPPFFRTAYRGCSSAPTVDIAYGFRCAVRAASD
jgi:formylglycine-generating enzyme required for sulfatase activity